jgi:mono/diheme cytochrome c family protein
MKFLSVFVLLAVGAGAALFYAGVYDISATDQHLAPTYWLLDNGMRRSVKQRAAEITPPDLGEPGQLGRGLALYREHCVQCHGAPGVAPASFALGMTPMPANLAYTAREWPPAEVFWVVKEGIKMTGMPAWRYRMSDQDIWAIVAVMRELPKLSPQEYRSRKVEKAATAVPSALLPADAQRGTKAIHQYGCVTCHQIPGIVGANAPVGPPLKNIATRGFIAGVLPNTPENMVRWLRHPQAVSPQTAMPDLGVGEQDAQDIAAYLLTLK